MADDTVATQDNPAATGDVPQSGTMDLDAAVEAQLAGNTPGDATTTPVQPSSPNAGAQAATPATDGAATTAAAPEAAPTDTPAVDAGTLTRLQQDVAQKDALLRAIGLDPDSESVELAAKGIIDPRTLIRTTPQTVQPNVAPPPVSPEVPLDERLANIQKHLEKGGDVDAEQYRADVGGLLNVVGDLVKANDTSQQQARQNEVKQMARNNTDATYAVINQSHAYKALNADQQQVVKALVLGATDVKAAEMAANPQIGTAKAFRPETYAHIAQSVTGQLESLLATAFANGKAAATQSIASPNSPVNPVQPGGGATPITPATPRITTKTLDDAVNSYLQKSTLPGLA